MDLRKLLDVDQAAERLGVHRVTVYRWAKANRVPAIRIGPKVIRFDPVALERFLGANTARPVAK